MESIESRLLSPSVSFPWGQWRVNESFLLFALHLVFSNELLCKLRRDSWSPNLQDFFLRWARGPEDAQAHRNRINFEASQRQTHKHSYVRPRACALCFSCLWHRFLVAEVLGGSSLLELEVSCKVCRGAFACSSLIGKWWKMLQTCSCPRHKFFVAEVLGGSSLLEVSCKVCRRAFACSSLIRNLRRHVHLRGTSFCSRIFYRPTNLTFCFISS